MTITLDRLVAEDFEPLRGQVLAIRAGGTVLDVVLEEVTPSPYPTGRALPGFSLLLRGPVETPLQQGMLALQHPVHGVLEVFFTPVRRDARGMRYEVVFN